MDIRVDLTENRDFRQANELKDIPGWKPYKHSTPFHDFLTKASKILTDSQGEYLVDNWGILQGNALDRKAKEWEKDFCNFITCDCCGRKLYPYYHDGLCMNCKDRLNYKPLEWRRENG